MKLEGRGEGRSGGAMETISKKLGIYSTEILSQRGESSYFTKDLQLPENEFEIQNYLGGISQMVNIEDLG